MTKIEITPEMKAAFVAEATENLDRFERALLELENGPESQDAINRAFRAVHGIKGNSDYLGIKDINALSNELEGLMDDLRRGDLDTRPHIVSVLFEGLDLLRDMNRRVPFDDYRETDISGFLEKLRQCRLSHSREKPVVEKAPREKVDITGVFLKTARQHMEYLTSLASEVLKGGDDPEAVTSALDRLTSFSHSAKYCGFEKVSRLLEAECKKLRQLRVLSSDRASELMELMEKVDTLIQGLTVGEVDMGRKTQPDGQTGMDLLPQKDMGEVRETDNHRKAASELVRELMDQEIRIAPGKVEDIMNLVSQLTIAGNRLNFELESFLAKSSDTRGAGRIRKSISTYNRYFKGLQNSARQLRLVPIEFLFQRLPRIVRDLSLRFGKKMEITMHGGKLEIDRKVIGQLVDPMIHLIRNAADHGIESPETRRQKNKPEIGQIRVKAFQEGSFAVIEIRDDGRGFDPERIRAAARKKGLSDLENLDRASDAEIVDMAFSPGFTTISGPVGVSGRGVGLDLVKSNLNAIGGDVTLRYEKDRGSTVILQVPVSMAVTEVLLLEVDSEVYALPMSCVAETLKVAPGDITILNGVETIAFKDTVLTITHLRRILDLFEFDFLSEPDSRPESELPTVVVSKGGHMRAVVADRLIGGEGIVIRPLEKKLAGVCPFSGAAIMADGDIVLVIDPGSLI